MAGSQQAIPVGDAARALRDRIHGTVALPDDAEYDDARTVWNGMIDRRPVAIVRVADVGDVLTAVGFASEQDLPIAVRGGGHNVAGNGTVDAGLVIDLAALNSIAVDSVRGTVRVGGGATLGDVDQATEPLGLAVAGGVVSMTGDASSTADIREAARTAYGDRKLARLTALKDRYDPDNRLRLNHNILPSG
jgi:FAD/FMN-containing dehydrogenase